MKLVKIILLSCLVLVSQCHKIIEENITKEEYIKRLKVFNDFYHKLNPSSKNVELRYDEESNSARLYALNDIKKKENYITFEINQLIGIDYIYSTKYNDVVTEIEESFGYDDIFNLSISILIEKFDEKSKWKPYIDILPTKPNNLIYNFWEDRHWMEPALKGLSLSSKFF